MKHIDGGFGFLVRAENEVFVMCVVVLPLFWSGWAVRLSAARHAITWLQLVKYPVIVSNALSRTAGHQHVYVCVCVCYSRDHTGAGLSLTCELTLTPGLTDSTLVVFKGEVCFSFVTRGDSTERLLSPNGQTWGAVCAHVCTCTHLKPGHLGLKCFRMHCYLCCLPKKSDLILCVILPAL